MVVWVWVLTGFYEVEGRESEREKHFQKIFFFPDFACAGKKENSLVFFLKKKKRKENVIWKNPKIGYDTCLTS
jgi:hypothetical protein